VDKLIERANESLTNNLIYMSEVIITSSNFEQEVLKSSLPVLIDFWAVWCGPCKVLSPIVEELATEFEGKLKVGKVNVDEENQLAQQYNIMSIPTLKIFKNGKVVGELIGAAPKATIEAEIRKHI
jgi:thioredoxin 1